MKKDPLVFIKHIHDSITDIEQYVNGVSRKQFDNNKMMQDAIIRKIEIIGEAAKNIPLNFTNGYPVIPWKDMVKMRDKLIHQYFGINLDRVWNVVKEEIPVLKQQIEKILEEAKSK